MSDSLKVSEKTQTYFQRYLERLVDRQPSKIRKLFTDGELFFHVSDEGHLSLGCNKTLPIETFEKALLLIEKYMAKYQCKAIREITIN